MTRQAALGQAAEPTRLAASRPLSPLTRPIARTCSARGIARAGPGSSNLIAPYDATVVARLRAAGAVLLGKLNMDEFAMGSSTEHSAFFPTRNPWDLDRVPGGSSGGSAAAAAADLAAATLGSDTGGSIRQPAAFCGTVGLKPTYGRVSRYGLIAFASSLDQIGPFAKTVADAALVLGVIAGVDPRDSTSVDVPVPDYRAALEDRGSGRDPRRVLRRDRSGGGGGEGGHRGARGLGRAEAVSLPHTRYGLAAYYVIAPAEASSTWRGTTA